MCIRDSEEVLPNEAAAAEEAAAEDSGNGEEFADSSLGEAESSSQDVEAN